MDDKDKSYLILKDNNIYKGLALLSLPIFLSNILKTIHDIVDTFFIGQLDNSTELQSAVGLTWPIFFIFVSFGIGLSIAGNALISQYLGSKDINSSRKYASELIGVSTMLGLIFTVLLFLITPLIMRFMGTDGIVFENSVNYIRIRSFEIPLLFIFFSYQAIRQASGDTLTPVLISVFGVILNIALTPLFVLVFNLGVSGAAYATLIANFSMVPFTIYFLLRSKSGVTISLKMITFSRKIISKILNIALPASFGQAIQAIGFLLLGRAIFEYGTNTHAAFFIGNRLSAVIMHPTRAISAVLATYIGQNIGAGNIYRAKKAFKSGLILSIFIMGLGSILAIPFRGELVQLFNDESTTVNLATEYTFYLFIGLPLMAVFQTFMATFQSSGRTGYSFFMAVIRLWVIRLPLVYAFKYFTHLGSSGIWYAMLISNFVLIFVGIYFYHKLDFLPRIDKKEELVMN